jgi:hypothetical protein
MILKTCCEGVVPTTTGRRHSPTVFVVTIQKMDCGWSSSSRGWTPKYLSGKTEKKRSVRNFDRRDLSFKMKHTLNYEKLDVPCPTNPPICLATPNSRFSGAQYIIKALDATQSCCAAISTYYHYYYYVIECRDRRRKPVTFVVLYLVGNDCGFRVNELILKDGEKWIKLEINFLSFLPTSQIFFWLLLNIPLVRPTLDSFVYPRPTSSFRRRRKPRALVYISFLFFTKSRNKNLVFQAVN